MIRFIQSKVNVIFVQGVCIFSKRDVMLISLTKNKKPPAVMRLEKKKSMCGIVAPIFFVLSSR